MQETLRVVETFEAKVRRLEDKNYLIGDSALEIDMPGFGGSRVTH